MKCLAKRSSYLLFLALGPWVIAWSVANSNFASVVNGSHAKIYWESRGLRCLVLGVLTMFRNRHTLLIGHEELLCVGVKNDQIIRC